MPDVANFPTPNLVMAACSVRAQPALKEGRSKACRDSRTSKGQAWQKEAEFSVSPGCFDDIYYMLLPPTVDGPAKSCTTWKMLKTVVSLYSLSHYWVEKPSFLVQHFTTIHRLLTGFPSYPPRPLDRETDQRKQLFVSSKKRQWTWKSDWENDYICTTIKLKNKQWKKNWVRVWYFIHIYIYIYKWHENLHKKHGEFHQHSICWVHPKMTGSNYLWS